MILLNPVAGLVAAALAAPVLVALYLLRLRRRAVRVSSTLLWQAGAHDLQVNVPLQRPRLSWLLLLQAAALACLSLALARPALRAPGAGAERVAIILDVSASMRATDGTPGARDAPGTVTRFEEARRRAGELVAGLAGPGGAETVVIAAGARPVALTSPTTDRATLLDAVGAAAATDEEGAMSEALRLARTLLARPDDEAGGRPPVAYVLSDGGDPIEPGAVAGLEGVLLRCGPAGTEPVRNTGLVAIGARRDRADPGVARVFVRAVHTEAAPRSVPIEVVLDGAPADVRTLRLEGAGADAPGGGVSTFDVRVPAGGLIEVRLTEPDVLSADDRIAAVLPPAGGARLLVVAPDGEPPDPLLLGALDALDPRAVQAIDATTYATWSGGASDVLAEVDVVVFDRVAPAAEPARPSLAFGAPLPALGVGIETGAGVGRIVSWRRAHPLMRDVGLDGVLVAPPSHLVLPASGWEVLASIEDGPVLAVTSGPRTARIAGSFGLARSNWATQVSFPVFVANAVERLAGRSADAPARAWRAGETPTVPAVAGARTLTLRGPAGVPVEVPAPGGEATLPPLTLAGVYEAGGAAPGFERLPVNVASVRESLAPVRDALAGATTPGRADAGGRTAATTPRELWRWFVLAAGVLATLEWVLYGLRMRA